MLITLLLWAYLLVLGSLYGRLTLHVLARFFKLDRAILPFSLTWLAGMGTLTALASLLSLFIKLALVAQVLVAAGGLLIGVWVWRTTRLSFHLPALTPLGMLLAALILVTVLEVSTHAPANPDTGLYHAQTIRWIESFPAVPGLGNLHSRLAYNSSWLVVNALFSFAFLGGRSYHVLPGLLFLVVTGRELFQGLRLLQSNRSALVPPHPAIPQPLPAMASEAQPSPPCPGGRQALSSAAAWLRLLLIPLAFFLLAGELSSPGTDLPAVLIAWLVFSEWASLPEDNVPPLQLVLLILIPIWAVTIKLSSLPLLLASLALWGQFLPIPKRPSLSFLWPPSLKNNRQLKWQPLTLKLLLCAALLLAPWVARSLILSGYLIYPGLTLDPFRFDWRIPVEAVRRESLVITAWARLSAQNMDTVLAMSLPEWVYAWYHNQTRNRKLMFVLVSAAPILYGLTLGLLGFFRRRLAQCLWQNTHPYLLPLGTAYLGVAFWFFKAPFFRFGYTFLIPALLLWLLPSLRLLGTRRLELLLILGMIVYQGSVLGRSLDRQTLPARLIQPADYVNLPTAPCELYDSRVWCAEQYGVCGYAAFPCVPGADPRVARRGPDLGDGYRYVDLP